MKCPECGHKMSIETKDITHTYRGKATIIKGATGKYCPECDEFTFSLSEAQRVSYEMMEFNKSVNASIVDPEYIVTVRKKLSLTQAEANKMFGGGPNAFSRYETGKALPPQSLIQLFQLLDRHPHLLQEIKSPPPSNASSDGSLAHL